MQEGEYEYYDGLKYSFKDWEYCTTLDRRFYTEIVKGMQPKGHELLVNPQEGPKYIPKGTYDIGQGYYDPEQNIKFSYDGKPLEDQEEGNEEWIIEKCRYNPKLDEKQLQEMIEESKQQEEQEDEEFKEQEEEEDEGEEDQDYQY